MTFRPRSLGLAGLLVGCSFAPALFQQSSVAQEAPATTQPSAPAAPPAPPADGAPMTETVVRARPESITVPSVERATEQVEQRPGGVDVIPAEDYERGRTQTLKDVLEFSPGVFVQPRSSGTSEEARLSIRGSGLQRTFHLRGIEILQDEVPINTADGSGEFEAIEPLSLRYTEVFRGGNALRYGSTTLGGAINFVTRTGYDASPFTVRLEGGSWGYGRAQVSSGQVVGPWDYYVSGTIATADGYRDHSQNNSRRLYGNVGYRVSENVETRFILNAVNYDSEIPGGLTKEQVEDDPREANPFQVAGDWQRNLDMIRLANKTTVRVDDHQRVDLIAFYAYRDLDHPIFQIINETSYDYGLVLGYSNEANLFGRRNLLAAGVKAHYGTADQRRWVNVGDGDKGALTTDGAFNSLNLTAYAEDQHYVHDRWALVLGAQAAYSVRDFDDDLLANGDQSDHFDYFGFNPKVGFRYELGDRLGAAKQEDAQVYGNYNRSFEPPSSGELVNLGGTGLLDLDEQSADTVEVGFRGRTGRVAWDVAYYHAWVHDELLGFNVGPGSQPLTVNAEDTIHQGVELGLDLVPWEAVNGPRGAAGHADRVVWRNMYFWNDFRFDGDDTFGDNRLAGIPEHFYRTELLFEHSSGFYFGPNLEWSMDHYPVDFANTLYADPYVLLGFRVGYRAEDGLSWFVEGRNLTNERYAASTGVITDASLPGANVAQFNPGDGPGVYLGVEYRY